MPTKLWSNQNNAPTLDRGPPGSAMILTFCESHVDARQLGRISGESSTSTATRAPCWIRIAPPRWVQTSRRTDRRRRAGLASGVSAWAQMANTWRLGIATGCWGGPGEESELLKFYLERNLGAALLENCVTVFLQDSPPRQPGGDPEGGGPRRRDPLCGIQQARDWWVSLSFYKTWMSPNCEKSPLLIFFAQTVFELWGEKVITRKVPRFDISHHGRNSIFDVKSQTLRLIKLFNSACPTWRNEEEVSHEVAVLCPSFQFNSSHFTKELIAAGLQRHMLL